MQKKNFGKSLYIDISKIKVLTIDALMYLLAMINNLKRNFQSNYTFSGNMPNDPNIKDLLIKSGFFQYVRYTGKGFLERNADNVQIVSGENVATAVAKKISDFVCTKAEIDKRECAFLYNMMIELMSNAHNHAYNQQRSVIYPQWYCFADYNTTTNVVSFTFMDTGEGIPTTVKKKFTERLDFLKLKGDNTYVVSALKGEFRTETQKSYRGKGLPKIREFCRKSKIQNMRIITNQADVTVHGETFEAKDLSVSLMGTLFYWQMDISSIKEEIF